MDSRFKNCLEEGKLEKISVQPDLVKKEIDAASFDLASAEKSIKENNPKWATVQAYYSMFHTAKALVLSKGYREKSHACLSIALKALFVDEGILEGKPLPAF
ncbi:HEPN domain-containing protein [Candidatus Micrarchaeota archaeon]|nr:HEPN domain-containing protein [Candidatus Micrarchaeota archaeon]